MQSNDDPKLSETTSPQELSLDDALQLAMQLHQASRLDDAELLYSRLLEVDPENPNVLHFFGMLKHEQGFSEEGIASISRGLALAPDYVDALNNLGNIFLQIGSFESAEPCFRHVVSLNPDFAAAHGNLGIVLRHCGRYEEANESLQKAIVLEPEAAHHYQNLANVYQESGNYKEAVGLYRKALELSSALHDYQNLANVHRNLGDYDEAVDLYRKSLALNPADSDTYSGLCRTLHLMGDIEQCIDVLEEWLQLDPENPTATHMYSAYTASETPSRASDGYVQQTFDRFAASFDAVLQRLEYQAPSLVDQSLQRLGRDTSDWNLLDAGCGTGLFGVLVMPRVKRLEGVDLSSKMLERAQARNVYDELYEAELTDFLISRPKRYDGIGCVDTLCYFGDLEAVFRAAFDALKPGGWFILTVEKQQEPVSSEGYRLNLHGRYSHSKAYLREILSERGFDVVNLTTAVLRKELGVPVTGFVVAARARGTS